MLVLKETAEFDFTSADYKKLYEQSDVTAFQHPAWQAAMQAHANGLSGVIHKTLEMRCKTSGELTAVIPLVARKVMGATILEYCNLGLVDYALPVLHREFWNWVPDPRDMSLELADVLGRYDMLRIKHIPVQEPLILRLFPNAYMERASFSAYAAELGSDYEEWRSGAISKSERKHRDKKRRAMLRNGDWQMQRLYDADEITTAFEHMRQFHKDRYADRPGEDMIQNSDAFHFYVNLAREQAQSGFVRVYQFTYQDRIVAVQFGITDPDRYYYLMMGIDYDLIGRYSPGLLMTEDIIRDCIKDGFSIFDLTVGDEPYKLKFGTKPIPIYTLWHAHSMLGQMGRTVAGIMQKTQLPNRLRQMVG